MAFSDYSATPASNLSIAGQNIAPGGPPSAVGPGIRQLMADGKLLSDKVSRILNVTDERFAGGAKGNGVADDTIAIKTAINVAVAFGYDRPVELYFPAGRYRITQSNVLGQWNSIPTTVNRGVIGLTIRGDGMMATQLVLENDSAATRYFWDNKQSAGVARDNSLQFLTVEDIGFVGTGTGTGSIDAFRSYGTANSYPSQGFRFNRCYFESLGYPLSCEGPVNDSEMTFFQCRAIATTGLIHAESTQNLNYTVVGTDVELYKGTVFDFLRGGQLTVIGGSYISFAQAGAETFVLASRPPDTGTGATFTFIGIRTELHSPLAKIVKLTGANNDSVVEFRNTAHNTRDNGVCPDAIQVGGQGMWSLRFDGAQFSGSDGITWVNNGVANYWTATGTTPELVIERSRGIDQSKVAWQANTLGFTRIAPIGAPAWEGGAFGTVKGAGSTTAQGTRLLSVDGYGTRWPNSSDGGAVSITADLPIGARVQNIWVEKPAFGGPTANYQLQVVDGAGNEIVVPAHGAGSPKSVAGPMNARHVIALRGLVLPATDANSARFAVRAVAGATGDGTVLSYDVKGARMIVEYFAS